MSLCSSPLIENTSSPGIHISAPICQHQHKKVQPTFVEFLPPMFFCISPSPPFWVEHLLLTSAVRPLLTLFPQKTDHRLRAEKHISLYSKTNEKKNSVLYPKVLRHIKTGCAPSNYESNWIALLDFWRELRMRMRSTGFMFKMALNVKFRISSKEDSKIWCWKLESSWKVILRHKQGELKQVLSFSHWIWT